MGDWGFGYDTLNRLTGMAAGNAPLEDGCLSTWQNVIGCYGYDSFGNRTMAVTTYTDCSYAGQTAYYTANNRIQSGSYGYDDGGNVISDGVNSYAYDAEGRLCAVKNVSGALTGYVYDAEGLRVAKGSLTALSCNLAANGFTLTNQYLLDAGGDQVTELDGAGNWVHSNVWAGAHLDATYDTTAGGSLHFHLADPQGTRRVQTNTHSAAEATFQSLPFGDGFSQHFTGLITSDDATENHFTGKERDAESGFDYFGAKYYASSMGRFMSPDWIAKEEGDDPVPYAKLDNPQTLNLYSYGLNNPLSRTDPDGHMSTDGYEPDRFNHGAPHIDRSTKDGHLVGRYNPDGTPIEHKGKTPPPIPKADQEKFKKAVEKLKYQEDVDNRPGVPKPPIPDGLKPKPDPAPNPFPVPVPPPSPNPGPNPAPEPTPTPFPGPSPEPLPLPAPEPLPMPLPEPIPFPFPAADHVNNLQS